jgi:hypothetical protein
MRQLMKRFLWVGLLVPCLQTASAFSLLGPVANGEDSWQSPEIAYATGNGNVPPYIGDAAPFGPKNFGEGYRRNTPVMYYTFDSSFGDYFGQSGELAVQQAFDIMNSLTNVDSYSANLSEFPLNSQSENYAAFGLGLWDVKSVTLSLLVEQLGLTDAIRYTWCLHNRVAVPGCTLLCPLCEEYLVVMRNYDFYLTPLGYNPLDWGQYSPYVNGALYTYYIPDNCDKPNPPSADAIERPADPLNNNPPVASGHGEGYLQMGFFYTGLTRDDAAGLRWLYSTNNYDTPSAGYMESAAAGSVATTGGGGGNCSDCSDSNLPTYSLAIYQTNSDGSFTILTSMDPATLQTNVPGIVITGSNTVIMNGQTYYTYTYATTAGGPPQFNLMPYSNGLSTNTTIITRIQTTTTAPVWGQRSPPTLFNTTTTTSATTNILNVVSRDFYVVPTNFCDSTLLGVVATNATAVTNNLGTVTNSDSVNYTTNITSTNIVTFSTNYILLVELCTNAPATPGTTNAGVVGDFQGIGRVRFVRVPDDNYDYMATGGGQFYNPITNKYSMVLMRNGQAGTVTFQRVVTAPDFVFSAQDMETGPSGIDEFRNPFTRNVNFNQADVPAGHAGPGTIASPSTITYNTVGPDFENSNPSFLTGSSTNADRNFIWSSFDGTTNTPIVYPNGASSANLTAQNSIQISPTTLPDGVNGAAYNVTNVTLSATGGVPPYSWTLAPGFTLPPGLTLTNNVNGVNGVISGIPTETGTFDTIVIRMTDSSNPDSNPPAPLSVDTLYSITIH